MISWHIVCNLRYEALRSLIKTADGKFRSRHDLTGEDMMRHTVVSHSLPLTAIGVEEDLREN
jgi:hypothetical protein